MKKMVIMQVLPALGGSGGVEHGTIEIATALQQAGIQNYVVSNGGVLVEKLKAMGVEHIQMPVHSKNPIMMFINAVRLSKVAKEKGVTLMHVRSRAPAWPVKWASAWTGIPFMTTFHGVYGIKPKLFKKPYNSVMLAGKKVIAVSNHVKNQILRDYETNPDKIRVIHRGVDENYVREITPAQTADFVKKYKIPTDKPIIMMQARLTKWKGQLALLEALTKMKHKSLTCILVGSHQGRLEYVKELEAKIAKLPATMSVMMLGVLPRNEMPVIYKLSDIVAVVSLKPEPFGRATPEGQVMGSMVVAFNHGGAVEMVREGETGFLVPPGDTKALAQKLDDVLDMDKGAKQKIREAAIKLIKRDFSVTQMQEKTLAIYREIHDEIKSKNKK